MRYITVFTLGVLLLIPWCARADHSGFVGWGPRMGVTVDPDQVHFGAHTDFTFSDSRVRLQPNIELGLGDNMTILALNFEGVYAFRSKWDTWRPYVGGGVGLDFISVDDNRLFRGRDDTEAGLNGIFGIERGLSSGSRFFLEGKVGLVDQPDLKFTTGWTFYH